tara:strand:+ start:446 stop:676 length:231 start_codon:yes stop_codon:yes gene_type:complete
MVNKLKETIKNDHLLNSSKVKIPTLRMTKKEIQQLSLKYAKQRYPQKKEQRMQGKYREMADRYIKFDEIKISFDEI